MPQAIAVIGVVASVAGTYMSYKGQKKAAKAQQQQQALATRRSRRQAIRQAQVVRAQATAQAYATGASGSSGAMGGIGALGSRLGADLGHSTQMSGISQNINRGLSMANTGAGIAGLGATAYSYGVNNGGSLSRLFSLGEPAPQAAPIPSGNTVSGWSPMGGSAAARYE